MEEEEDNEKTEVLDKEQEMKMNLEKEQKEIFETAKKEIRDSFQQLMNQKLLKAMWINITQLFSEYIDQQQLGNNVVIGLLEKLQPVLECFLIIYQIMEDDEIVDVQDKQFIMQKKLQ